VFLISSFRTGPSGSGPPLGYKNRDHDDPKDYRVDAHEDKDGDVEVVERSKTSPPPNEALPSANPRVEARTRMGDKLENDKDPCEENGKTPTQG